MPGEQNLNPYASPLADQVTPEILPSRAQAQLFVRRTLLIMAVPVAINIWAMFFLQNQGLHPAWRGMLVAGNAIWFSFLFVVLWFFALRLMELLARVFYMLFGGSVSRDEWLTSLHQSLWPMVPATSIGSVLWILWLCLFFLADHPGGFALDVVFQIAGHALGAWVYLTVLWNWYQLRQGQPVSAV